MTRPRGGPQQGIFVATLKNGQGTYKKLVINHKLPEFRTKRGQKGARCEFECF